MYQKNLHRLDHPVLQHKLSQMRDRDTTPAHFRLLLGQIAPFIAYEASRHLPIVESTLTTPLEKMQAPFLSEEVAVVSIMRAGNGMLEGVLDALPNAQVGHIGIYRDKFINNTVEYYFKLPLNMEGKRIFLVDPMVATADTALSAIARLKEYNVGPISLLSLLISPIAMKRLHEAHPEIHVYCLSLERELNEHGYLLPGIGDAGDRLYGTL